MSFRLRPVSVRAIVLAAAALAAAGCSDDASVPTAAAPADSTASAAVSEPTPLATPRASADEQRARAERLAERLARALGDEAVRSRVHAALAASPFREHKLHFQRWLAADGGRNLAAVAAAARIGTDELERDAAAAIPLELYLPVPEHRAAWRGEPGILVATALADADRPVAFDALGARRLLDADRPPAVPVLALVPVETNFDRTDSPTQAKCVDCGGGGTTPTPGVIPGLYMTASQLNETFESWLKGSPEIEILVLGQKGATDSLTKYQCIGERAAGAYYFDQNDRAWSGGSGPGVLLFSQTQLDGYKAQHPTQGIRLFFMEDDDTSCEIKNDPNRIRELLRTVDEVSRGLGGGTDTKTTLEKLFIAYTIAQKLYAAFASVINSNDDLIGNAVEATTVGEFQGSHNWVLKGENGTTNGYVTLQMR